MDFVTMLLRTVGNFIHYLSTFLAGLVVGVVSAWKLALHSVAIIPRIAFAGGLYAYTLTGLTSKSRESYANAGIIAEQMMEELFLHLYAQNSTLPAMVQILAGFATSDALQFTPRLKGVLSKVLPILGNVKDQHRPIFANDIVAAAMLSRNRNFEGRVHPLTRANYLASPPLVVAYALGGTVCVKLLLYPQRNTQHKFISCFSCCVFYVDIDFENEPIGTTKDGKNA
ncbi:unnamed protein product [Lactuca virosa]|uniref:ABC transmembrane type-1 domain-containing protein n=1 Tax=Lactuca virosa TaxID=75947 RepID=A0AAU9MQC5_9ASTR|nr:unnamed protein product [Lactuca virosa]